MNKGKITKFLKTQLFKSSSFQIGYKQSIKSNFILFSKSTKNFSSVPETEHIQNKINPPNKLEIIDVNSSNQIKIPFYCSFFHLAQILNVEMIELVNRYKETLNQDINDPMEYLNKDDLELFLLESGIDFEIEKHDSKMIKRPMVVTIMGHVDHG